MYDQVIATIIMRGCGGRYDRQKTDGRESYENIVTDKEWECDII